MSHLTSISGSTAGLWQAAHVHLPGAGILPEQPSAAGEYIGEHCAFSVIDRLFLRKGLKFGDFGK